jgi:hypothetical protein
LWGWHDGRGGPPIPIPFSHNLSSIPRGPKGTEATLRVMEALVREGSRDPGVVLHAQQAVRNTPEYGKWAEVEAILADARRSMRYTADPAGMETIKSPIYTLQEIRRYGRAVMDCDDVSVWVAALLRAVGLNTRFKVIKDDPFEFTHVYLEVEVDGEWAPVDPIARKMTVGQEPTGLFGSAIFQNGRLSGIRRQTMYKGLGASTALAPAVLPYSPARATTPTGWDAIATAISTPLQDATKYGLDYLKNMYLPGAPAPKGPPSTRPAPRDIAARPGFFQKLDPATGAVVMDPMKVGGTVAVAGLLALIVFKRRR